MTRPPSVGCQSQWIEIAGTRQRDGPLIVDGGNGTHRCQTTNQLVLIAGPVDRVSEGSVHSIDADLSTNLLKLDV